MALPGDRNKMSQLPPGFVLDAPPANSGGNALPPGFVLDAPKSVGGFIQNIGSDAYNTAEGIVSGLYAGGKKLVTDPVGAGQDVYNAGDTAGAVLSGGLGHLYNAAVPEALEMTPGPDMNLASQVGGYLKDRYWDNLGDTLYEHPVQSAMDVASLAYGGQAALPKAFAGTKKALGTVAEVTNPLNVIAKPAQMAMGSLAESRALREMRAKAPTLDQVVARKNALYSALDNAGIKFDANSYNQMLGSLSGKLKTFRAARAPMTADAVKNMMTFNGKSPSFRDVEEMLIEAKGILRERSATNADKAAAQIMLDEVDSFFNKAPVMSNGSINPADISSVAKEARELARRHIIAREVGEIDRKSKWYTSGDESGVRNQFASFGKRQGKSLTPLEEKAAKKVVRREGVHGLLNTAGSKLTQSILLGSLGFGVGIPAAIGGGALSLGGRAASAAMTNAKADQFLKTVLAGKGAQNAATEKAKRLPISAKKPLLSAEIARLLTEHQ
jgi:hypothetical protein